VGRLTLRLDGRQVDYLPAGQPAPTDEGVKNLDVLEDRQLLRHERMRRILVRLLPNWPLLYYQLHWSDGSDLAALDERVRAGTTGDADFAGALVTELRDIFCRNCQAGLRVAVVDTGHVIFAADRARRLAEHRFRTDCPVCAAPLPPHVTEVLQE
jgi:hypothetical protein